jgi:hypothetical protein
MANSAERLVTFGRRHLWKGTAFGLAFVILALGAPGTEAHKAITSKYTYNEHVFPILRDRCGQCHFEGGPTPMSLTTYRDAVPWAESIREQLMAQRMPPWYADPLGPAVRGGHTISTKEIDVLITWSVGGTPQGDISTDPPSYTAPPPQWQAGTPDLTIPLEKDHTLPPGTTNETVQFTLPTGLKETRWVKAAALLPGNPSLVREAIVSVENGPILLTWVPGNDAAAPPAGAAFKLAAGSKLNVQIYYKKHWTDEQNAVSDRSTVGLYFTEAPLSGREVESLSVKAPDSQEDSHEPKTFSTTFKTNARLVGVRPSFDDTYASVDIDAVLPNGRRVSVLKLRSAQPQWYRRYWLQEPIEIPQGARLEIVARPAPVDEFAIPVTKRHPLQVAVDYVPL